MTIKEYALAVGLGVIAVLIGLAVLARYVGLLV